MCLGNAGRPRNLGCLSRLSRLCAGSGRAAEQPGSLKWGSERPSCADAGKKFPTSHSHKSTDCASCRSPDVNRHLAERRVGLQQPDQALFEVPAASQLLKTCVLFHGPSTVPSTCRSASSPPRATLLTSRLRLPAKQQPSRVSRPSTASAGYPSLPFFKVPLCRA